MQRQSAARLKLVGDDSAALFDGIRAFLAANHLSPDPHHYAFAYDVVTNPSGALAQTVAGLTDGGVRLAARDIEALGGTIGSLAPPPVSFSAAPTVDTASAPAASPMQVAEGLVARTQLQVEGFTDMMHSMRAEAQGFGRDLAASADAMRGAQGTMGVDQIIALTSAMLDRVRTAETRLEEATHEASELRVKLEEARENARRDPLTDLPNRRAFEEAFAAQIGLSVPLCLAVCDVDRFKRVNDQFGHSVGDRVLKAIGDALLKACAGHLVARYGGEEFAVLFTGLDRDTALATLDTAREAVAAKRYRLRESEQPLGAVTFSAGLTLAEAGESFASAFARADALLYAAKDSGRNQLRAG